MMIESTQKDEEKQSIRWDPECGFSLDVSIAISIHLDRADTCRERRVLAPNFSLG